MEQFIDETVEYKYHRVGAKTIALYQNHLIGSDISFSHLSYLRFLKSLGLEEPEIKDFNAKKIGQYWEFMIQHYGGIQAANAMNVLRRFWIWCQQNQFVKGDIPSDIRTVSKGPLYPFQINVALKQR